MPSSLATLPPPPPLPTTAHHCQTLCMCSHCHRFIGAGIPSAAAIAYDDFVPTASTVASIVAVKGEHVAHCDERGLETHTHDTEEGDVHWGLTIAATAHHEGERPKAFDH